MIRTLRALIVCCSVGVTARTLWQGSRDVLPQTVELLGCVRAVVSSNACHNGRMAQLLDLLQR